MISIDEHTLLFVKEHETDDVRQLALKAASYPLINFRFALKQIASRQIAKSKFPLWYGYDKIIYPQQLSIEQSSSEKTAIYKADLLKDDNKNNTLIDLTGGLGVDFSFMSPLFKKAFYVEKQPELVKLAQHNFDILGIKNATIVQENAENYLRSIEATDHIIYIDPARRNESGKKTIFIEDCSPDLMEIDKLLDEKSQKTVIKLSPMLDISRAIDSLKNISQVHVVSVNNETKELLLIKEKNQAETRIYCINLLNNSTREVFCFTKKQEENAIAALAGLPGKYLYEPNSSIMKAGAYKSIAVAFNLKKLHPNSHLYTSDKYIAGFPGRKFIVKNTFSHNKKNMKQYLRDISQANISVRNYPLCVAEIRKQTKLKDGGCGYIFATTLSNEKKVLILCEKTDS